MSPVERWKKLGPAEPATPVFYGKSLLRQRFRRPNGEEEDFYLYGLPDNAAVFAVTTDKQVLLVREFMQGAGEILDWIGGGLAEEGETLETTARRELRQETGYEPEQLIDLGAIWFSPRHSTAKVHLFLALGCHRVGEQELDVSEEIDLVQVPLSQWIDLVVSGKIADSLSTTATLRALRHLGYRVELG